MKTNKSRCSIVSIIVAHAMLLLTTSGAAALSSYSENFESLVISDPDALGNAGWVVYGNVFDPAGNYIYGYGTFPAPNNSGGFSAIAEGEGGPAQGIQQLSVYSDYNNYDDMGHGGGNLIESNVFVEQLIDAADVGSTWMFTFDAKAGNILDFGSATAAAFIKTIDPANGFALTNIVLVDTTNLLTTWDTFSLTLFIDAGLTGQLLQFGFLNVATNFDPSGVFYDNVQFAPVPVPAAVWLLLSAVAGMAGLRRTR
ncbi:MAG: VPLPA-CTERM sorting domain-containing protein [Gammaproteobacteria bacterium]|nr:VPLPA-CTERM sorting domain-containing protein [Gammaproteobacteria bacterium]